MNLFRADALDEDLRVGRALRTDLRSRPVAQPALPGQRRLLTRPGRHLVMGQSEWQLTVESQSMAGHQLILRYPV